MLSEFGHPGMIKMLARVVVRDLSTNFLTVNYRYNVINGTLKKLRHIRFYVIPV